MLKLRNADLLDIRRRRVSLVLVLFAAGIFSITDVEARDFMAGYHVEPGIFSSPAERRLADAVAGGSMADVMALAPHVAGGVNVVAPNGTTLLLIAVNRENVPMISTLIKAGADPNGGRNGAPLALAVRAADLGIARMLLEAGADPNGVLDDCALAVAAQIGREDAIELLLRFHADVDFRNGVDDTPALTAASTDHWPCAAPDQGVAGCRELATTPPLIPKSFLVLFFKKELLACLALPFARYPVRRPARKGGR